MQQKRFFVNNINSMLGYYLVEHFRNDDLVEENENIIIGTINPNSSFKVPTGTTMIFKKDNAVKFRKQLLECDVLVFDLINSDIEEVEYVIKTLKSEKLEKEMIFIAISSVLVWGYTPPNLVFDKEIEVPMDQAPSEYESVEEEESEIVEKQEIVEQDQDNIIKEEEIEDAEESQINQSKNSQVKKSDFLDSKESKQISQDKQHLEQSGEVHKPENVEEQAVNVPQFRTKTIYKKIPFTEQDYNSRKPPPKYEPVKALESLLLSISFNKDNLNSYIIASGLKYGNGEELLNYHFRSAWIQEPEELPFIGNGDNIIPTIHIRDLATLINKVIVLKPEQKYIFGIDCTKNPQQKTIIQTISTSIGSGKIKAVSYQEVSEEPWAEMLLTDL